MQEYDNAIQINIKSQIKGANFTHFQLQCVFRNIPRYMVVSEKRVAFYPFHLNEKLTVYSFMDVRLIFYAECLPI